VPCRVNSGTALCRKPGPFAFYKDWMRGLEDPSGSAACYQERLSSDSGPDLIGQRDFVD